MRTLVVYYSLGGTTRKLAESIANSAGADIAEIRCAQYGPGMMSFLAACYDSVMGRLPEISVSAQALSSYDLVVVGGPVWAGHAATPVRRFLTDHRQELQRIATFVTFGGSGGQPALTEMATVSGKTPQAELAQTTNDVLGNRFPAALENYVQRFKLKTAA